MAAKTIKVPAGLSVEEWFANRGEGQADAEGQDKAAENQRAAPGHRYKTDISVRQQADDGVKDTLQRVGDEARLYVGNEEDSRGVGARDRQVGGDHYGPGDKVQAIDLILDGSIGFCEGSAIKYLCRWRKKGGVQDLQKAIHYIEMLIEHEEKNNNELRDTGPSS